MSIQTFPEKVVYDGDLYYEPFLAEDGRIGYRVSTTDGTQETFIYFNPSSTMQGNEREDKPNVFVYIGGDNDPAIDMPQIHFLTDPREIAE